MEFIGKIILFSCATLIFIILYCIINLIRKFRMREKYVPLRAWRLLGYIYSILFLLVCLFFIATPFAIFAMIRIAVLFFWEIAGYILLIPFGLSSVYLSLFIVEGLIRKDIPDFKTGVKIFFNKKERRRIGRN